MSETYHYIQDLMYGRRPLHRENPKPGESEWYYMTPKNPDNLDDSAFNYVDVPTQNTPNPLLGGTLAKSTATPILPSEQDLLKIGWQNPYKPQNKATPVTEPYSNEVFANAGNLQHGILNQAVFNRPVFRQEPALPLIPVPPRKPCFVDYSLYGDDMPKELIDNMLNDERFQTVMLKTRQNEGGYNNDPDDPGGETNFGISSKYYPDEDKKKLTRERADAILYRDYWLKYGINKLPLKLAEPVYDRAANQGQVTSIQHLHRALGLKPGTIIGNQTMNALQNADLDAIIQAHKFNSQQQYDEKININPKLKKFKNGWENRL